MFEPDDRVRVNWQRKGKYYDARIIDRDSAGYLVEYMDSMSSADQFENKVRAQDIIGSSMPCAFCRCKPCLHATQVHRTTLWIAQILIVRTSYPQIVGISTFLTTSRTYFVALRVAQNT